MALLEVLREWDAFVEVPAHEAIDRLAELVRTRAIRVDRLSRASATEPPRVRERLRRLLNALGDTKAARAVRPARTEAVQNDLALTG